MSVKSFRLLRCYYQITQIFPTLSCLFCLCRRDSTNRLQAAREKVILVIMQTDGCLLQTVESREIKWPEN